VAPGIDGNPRDGGVAAEMHNTLKQLIKDSFFAKFTVWHCFRDKQLDEEMSRLINVSDSHEAVGRIKQLFGRTCIVFVVFVLSHWVQAAFGERPDLPALKCSSYVSGVCRGRACIDAVAVNTELQLPWCQR
jgi:hypothetical protein